ncbi:hypothetical protein [Nostoc sp.]
MHSSKAPHQQFQQPHQAGKPSVGRTVQHCRVQGTASGVTSSIQGLQDIPG